MESKISCGTGCDPKADSDDDRSPAMPKTKKSKAVKNPTCFKCKEKATFNYKNGQMACGLCFKTHIFENKIKGNLRSALGVKKKFEEHKFFVQLSGGGSSIALAKAISEALKPSPVSGRKMFFKAQLVHVDESLFYEGDSSENNINRLKEFAKEIDLELHIISLPEIFEKDVMDFTNMIKSLKDAGDCREDLIVNLKRQALYKFFKQNDVKKIISGENGDTLAKKAFTSMIKGKGIEMINDSNKLSKYFHDEDIIHCRPLRDSSIKDVLYYNYVCDNTKHILIRRYLCMGVKGKTLNLPGKGSFDLQIENFLGNLQQKFDSTIPTVLSTTEKLDKPVQLKEKCRVCGLSLDLEFNVLEIGADTYLCQEYVDISDGLEMKDIGVLNNIIKPPQLAGLCYGCCKIMQNSADMDESNNLLIDLMQNLSQINPEEVLVDATEVANEKEPIVDNEF